MQIFDENQSLNLMIADLSRLMRKLCNQNLVTHDISVSVAQWQVLVRMWQEDGLTQTELAERVEIEQPSLVRHLDNLEQRGLIERHPDPHDRRTNRVFLTASCKPILEKMTPAILAVRHDITKDLSDQEFTQMMTSLQKIKNRTARLLSDPTASAAAMK